ncbi:MAG TPA: MgtC/SapB family protein [Rhizomicrobium sp.]|nr:MgtC/SapB family protein [Rhizomicrobium sp.]
MSAAVGWPDIVLRLGAALLAGAIVGYDRTARGRIAGLRTTILISLAAAGAMIEGNMMLAVVGKTQASFSVMDVLRFPLGILSGIGFIGAGAIVRRGSLVTGVTTAATMWLMTVVGLVLGAGYFFLGGSITAVAFVVLSLFRELELKVKREHRGRLTLEIAEGGPTDAELEAAIRDAGMSASAFASARGPTRILRFSVAWRDRDAPARPPGIVQRLAERSGIVRVDWQLVNSEKMEE